MNYAQKQTSLYEAILTKFSSRRLREPYIPCGKTFDQKPSPLRRVRSSRRGSYYQRKLCRVRDGELGEPLDERRAILWVQC